MQTKPLNLRKMLLDLRKKKKSQSLVKKKKRIAEQKRLRH